MTIDAAAIRLTETILGDDGPDLEHWIADSSIELSKSLPLKALIVRLS
jgi:hypothetical protein